MLQLSSYLKKQNGIAPIILILILVLLGAGGFALYRYNYQIKPFGILEKSFKKMENTSSASLNLDIPFFKTKLTANLHKEDLSSLKLDINQPEYDASVKMLVSSTNLYFQSTFSKMAELEKEITNAYPELTQMKTYTLLKPVLYGDSWLHMPLPAESKTDSTDKKTDKKSTKDKQEEELVKLSRDAITLRKYESNYTYQGTSYQRLVFGFKKDKLIALLEKTKDMDLDIKVNQINALIRVVKSVDNWNDDILEFLIDKDDNFYSLALSLPEIPEDALKESIKEGAGKDSNFSGMIEGSLGSIQKIFNQKEKGKLVSIGRLVVTNYNNAPKVSTPDDVVEAEEVMKHAQKELLPFISQLTGKAAGSYPTPATQFNPVNKTPAVTYPNCTNYNIREGEFASNKCYSQQDYSDLQYYLSQYNSAVFNLNGAQSSMNITCSCRNQQECDFFKNSCDNDKKKKATAETNIAKYKGIIQGIIARGK